MNCTYCGTKNSDDDHRCKRCGRRLHAAPARPAPDPYPAAKSSPAPAVDHHARKANQDLRPQLVEVRRKPPQQAPLFPPLERPGLNALRGADTPASPGHPAARPRQRAPGAAPPARSSPAARRSSSAQGILEFELPEVALSQPARASADGSHARGATVAQPAHRVLAAVLDLSMILIGLGAFLLLLHLFGGRILLTRATIPFYGAAALGVAFLYKLLWCLADSDSPGMLWTHLRLLNFDGHRPMRRQRMHRLFGSCVSLLPGGLGLLWILVDEESLGWHDHISRTFPSPHPPCR